jgi:low affinity Fe/Cu permease
MPSAERGKPGVFDRFADTVAAVTAKAWFFAACVGLVVLWAPSIFIVGTIDTWQLIINTATTIVTFLLVGLMQNTQDRANRALQQKLNALAAALSTIVDDDARRELRDAVGLENREAS